MTHYPVIVIRNHDRNNNKFRPSDWADRLAGTAARYEQGGVRYDARVMPCRRCDSLHCLKVERTIGDDQPHVMENVVSFMKLNELDDNVAHCPMHAEQYTSFMAQRTQ